MCVCVHVCVERALCAAQYLLVNHLNDVNKVSDTKRKLMGKRGELRLN